MATMEVDEKVLSGYLAIILGVLGVSIAIGNL